VLLSRHSATPEHNIRVLVVWPCCNNETWLLGSPALLSCFKKYSVWLAFLTMLSTCTDQVFVYTVCSSMRSVEVDTSTKAAEGQEDHHWLTDSRLGRSQWQYQHTHTHTHTHTHLTALVPGLPRWAGTRKVKTSLDFTEARDSEWQWHQLGHMQLCTSLQTDNHASTPPLCFYRPDALPAAQPTASKHWRHNDSINCRDNYQLWLG